LCVRVTVSMMDMIMLQRPAQHDDSPGYGALDSQQLSERRRSGLMVHDPKSWAADLFRPSAPRPVQGMETGAFPPTASLPRSSRAANTPSLVSRVSGVTEQEALVRPMHSLRSIPQALIPRRAVGPRRPRCRLRCPERRTESGYTRMPLVVLEGRRAKEGEQGRAPRRGMRQSPLGNANVFPRDLRHRVACGQGSRSPLGPGRGWHSKQAADASGSSALDGYVPRTQARAPASGHSPRHRAGAMMIQEAAVETKVPFERPSVHAFTRVSFLINLRRDAARAVRASRAFSNASSTVSASVMRCGSSGEVTT
jgi:hypothetical protein